MNILLGVVTVVLVVVSLFLILVILMQKAKSDGGMGGVIGGGMAESAFGADTGNVFSKATINATVLFFLLAVVLYLGRVYQRSHGFGRGAALPTIAAPAQPAPFPAPMTPAAPAAPSAASSQKH